MSEQKTQAAAPAASPASGGKAVVQNLLHGPAARSLGLVVALAVLFLIGAITSGDRFMSADNMLVILRYASIIGVVSVGVTFVITAGGIDLSVGSLMGLTSVVASLAVIQSAATQSTWLLMVAVGLVVGMLAGFINGVIIAYGNVVAFIATVAMLVAARGLAEIISERRTLLVTNTDFTGIMRDDILGIPVLVWIFAVVAAAGWFLLNRTTFGRRTVAIGGNIEASRLAGIKVKRHLVSLYVLAGLTAGIAGVMMMGRTTSGTSTHGLLYELDAIAAVVVGGTLLAGGRGTIMGTVLGVLIFSTLTNVFTQNNMDTSVQSLIKGAIIVTAVMLQQRFAVRKERKAKTKPVRS
ncbi:ABC transporter permease [Zhihengliuella salsuginis]|uniref:Sugar ABC transporter permease n=1 Tax=Zhihengliuella salsuginis TaxID=578222 RepID=A0ABQ3GI95_9MICC|nr:ABC transporter permease [Zhihengliuella salsuginis]GHD04832.1 sugar ABC transporter permease [Zhihengliuella salsuginis]